MKIDRNIVVLGFVSYFTDMASAMINPIFPIFLVTVLHQGVDKLGIVVAVATFVSYALRLISGYISDRYGVVKPLVVWGYAFSVFSKPLIGLSQDYKSVAVLKAVERLGKALRSAPKDSMIAHYSPKKLTGKTFGFHKTLDIAGELSGTLLLFATLLFFGQDETVIRNIFYATLIPGIIGLILVIFFVEDVPKTPKIEQKSFKLTSNDKKALKDLIFYFLFLLFMFNEAFFTMQAKEVGIAVVLIPLLYVVSTFTQTLTSYISGALVDRFGFSYVMLIAYLCGVVAQLLLWFDKPIFTWIAFMFMGLFTVASLNANRAMIAKVADNRGSVYGIFYASVALLGAIGAVVSGFIWEKLGIESALMYALVGTAAIFLLYVLKRIAEIKSNANS
ncbi:MFS transporter [Hydrogenimonas thermophila]|uniref:MFS-type transporter involved in bile tolerance, Atg22 family n=1 Tax=Hydrogenimonas thermophila TaxID=223786 RepID=A0A1I5SBU8_9BACT|nr:MFS transporter [Hydrogenimonas thermophila]SFP67796.1 MFS-type transporter involved in bile tolerance, Atg22 family [Hydrogenimonas thermophila]